MSRTKSARAVTGLLAAAAVLALAAAGCGSDDNGSSGSSGSSGGSGEGAKIAFLLPENKTARYEANDKPEFIKNVKRLCANCEVIYENAQQDPAKQQQQAEAALTNGAKVLVLDAVDVKAAAGIVARAKQSGVPVVSYGRLVSDADLDYYVSIDPYKVGQQQAQVLLDALDRQGKSDANIVMINGSPTDSNSAPYKKGAHSVLDGKVKILKEYDTPDWSPDKAQSWMEGQISAVKGNLVGVYAANDGTGGGAIAALKGGGVTPLPPVTGQDAELAAIQRILAGDQAMTIYKPIKPEAEAAAKAALALANKQKPESTTDFKGVPSTILDPIAVTKENVKDTVVKDGIYKVEDICTPTFAEACKAAGLS